MSSRIERMATADGEVIDIERLGVDADGNFSADILRWQIETAGQKKSDAEAAAKLLEKMAGPVLAQLTNAVRRQSPDLTRKEAEDIAKGSDEYVAHVDAQIEAERVYGHANARWKAVLAFADALRTQQADKRAVMNQTRNHS